MDNTHTLFLKHEDCADLSFELCRLQGNRGGLAVFLPARVRRKLALNGESHLLAIIDGSFLFFVKDQRLTEVLRPEILSFREAQARFLAFRRQKLSKLAEPEVPQL